jgi:hypothetical protein
MSVFETLQNAANLSHKGTFLRLFIAVPQQVRVIGIGVIFEQFDV